MQARGRICCQNAFYCCGDFSGWLGVDKMIRFTESWRLQISQAWVISKIWNSGNSCCRWHTGLLPTCFSKLSCPKNYIMLWSRWYICGVSGHTDWVICDLGHRNITARKKSSEKSVRKKFRVLFFNFYVKFDSNITDNFKNGIKTFFDESKTLKWENEDYFREVATFSDNLHPYNQQVHLL